MPAPPRICTIRSYRCRNAAIMGGAIVPLPRRRTCAVAAVSSTQDGSSWVTYATCLVGGFAAASRSSSTSEHVDTDWPQPKELGGTSDADQSVRIANLVNLVLSHNNTRARNLTDEAPMLTACSRRNSCQLTCRIASSIKADLAV